MFDADSLGVFARDGAFTVWVYRSASDLMDDITAAGYFDAAATTLQIGDMILAVVNPRRGKSQLLHVSGNDEDGVDVEAISQGGLMLPPALLDVAR